MIWSFIRAAAQVDIEVRRTRESPGYELVVDYPDGSERVERFTNARRLVERTLHLQQHLIDEGWRPARLAAAGVPRCMVHPPRAARLPRALTRIRRLVIRRLAASFGL